VPSSLAPNRGGTGVTSLAGKPGCQRPLLDRPANGGSRRIGACLQPASLLGNPSADGSPVSRDYSWTDGQVNTQILPRARDTTSNNCLYRASYVLLSCQRPMLYVLFLFTWFGLRDVNRPSPAAGGHQLRDQARESFADSAQGLDEALVSCVQSLLTISD